MQHLNSTIRRTAMAMAVAALLPAVAATSAKAESRDDIIAAAKKEGAILWYDSLPRDQGEAILRDFQKEYPFVTDIEYLEVPGSQKIARITQESRAGGPTADVVINNAAGQKEHYDNGFLLDVDWAALGVKTSPAMTPTPYMIATAVSIYGLLYNTDKLSADEAPKSWDELVDPEWKGRIGPWARALGLVQFETVWGQEKTEEYVKAFAKLDPKLYRSTYTIAQSVGAGEIDLAFTIYHTALPTVDKGAPVKFVFLDPTPVSVLYASPLKYGEHPNVAKLFLAWLSTKNGALSYEAVAKRGNYLVPETETAKMLEGRTLAVDPAEEEIAQAAHINEMEGKYARILAGR